MRWLDGIIDSVDMSLMCSGSWWWTGKSMGSQRVHRVAKSWTWLSNWTEWLIRGMDPQCLESQMGRSEGWGWWLDSWWQESFGGIFTQVSSSGCWLSIGTSSEAVNLDYYIWLLCMSWISSQYKGIRSLKWWFMLPKAAQSLISRSKLFFFKKIILLIYSCVTMFC